MDAEAFVHIVMDAYHGDVITVPGRLLVLRDPAPEGDGHAPATLITVRVESREGFPAPPHAEAWHLRFVAPHRALDARTSDGTLKSLTWEDAGFEATLEAGDAIASLDVGPSVAARRVTHVLVVPESRTG